MSWDFYNSETRKAAKVHKCTLCGKDIVPGERYTYSAGKWCGEFQQQYLHKTCENIINCYVDETDENEWSEDDIEYFLFDKHCMSCKKYKTHKCSGGPAINCKKIRKEYKED